MATEMAVNCYTRVYADRLHIMIINAETVIAKVDPVNHQQHKLCMNSWLATDSQKTYRRSSVERLLKEPRWISSISFPLKSL